MLRLKTPTDGSQVMPNLKMSANEATGSGPLLFAGTNSQDLGAEVAEYLGVRLGKIDLKRFSDGECFVKLNENVRGRECFIIQSTCSPVNDAIIELLLITDALRRASATRICAVIPYFGYARQDRKDQGRVALSAKLVANLIVTAGVERVVTIDLHAGQIQGFFDIPVDHLQATPLLVDHVRSQFNLENSVVLSPDVGSVKRAREYGERLGLPLTIIDKRRPRANVAEVMNVIGEVKDKQVLIFDDMIDTAGTLCSAAQAIVERGASNVIAVSTHAVLSGPAIERLRSAPIRSLIVTNTIPPKNDLEKMRVVSVAPLLGESIKRIYLHQSVSSLFH
jgi:ribose-phosphate pyrophosphokinase